MIDWDAAKMEYITDSGASYHSIAEKYGVSQRQIERVGRRDGWSAARAEYVGEVTEKIKAATIETTVDGLTKCVQVAQKLLIRIEQRVDDTEQPIISSEYRQISGAIKDIREIMSEGESKDNTIQIIMGEAEEFIR